MVPFRQFLKFQFGSSTCVSPHLDRSISRMRSLFKSSTELQCVKMHFSKLTGTPERDPSYNRLNLYILLFGPANPSKRHLPKFVFSYIWPIDIYNINRLRAFFKVFKTDWDFRETGSPLRLRVHHSVAETRVSATRLGHAPRAETGGRGSRSDVSRYHLSGR